MFHPKRMSILKIPALMKSYVDNQTEVTVTGETVACALADLVSRYPAIKTHIMDGKGELRRYVNLFVNNENIKTLDGMDTALKDGDQLILLPSISGG
jgi:adenylyltransferase/sulfurtransferase